MHTLTFQFFSSLMCACMLHACMQFICLSFPLEISTLTILTFTCKYAFMKLMAIYGCVYKHRGRGEGRGYSLRARTLAWLEKWQMRVEQTKDCTHTRTIYSLISYRRQYVWCLWHARMDRLEVVLEYTWSCKSLYPTCSHACAHTCTWE